MPKCKLEIVQVNLDSLVVNTHVQFAFNPQRMQELTAKDMKTISSYMCSVRYLRKMVPLVVYNIIYNRINFDESFFVDRTVCEISFKMFKSGTKNHILADIFFCCKGVKEAIEKEYVRNESFEKYVLNLIMSLFFIVKRNAFVLLR